MGLTQQQMENLVNFVTGSGPPIVKMEASGLQLYSAQLLLPPQSGLRLRCRRTNPFLPALAAIFAPPARLGDSFELGGPIHPVLVGKPYRAW